MYTLNQATIMYTLFTILDCPIWFTNQSPTQLKCNPMGIFIFLRCSTRATTKSVAYNVTWYWSQCVNDAGTKGTAILLENNRDEYFYIYNSYYSYNGKN